MSNLDNCNEGKTFVEFRRKVQAAEVLSAAIEHLLKSLKFSGKLSVMVQNGRVLKSGYEEGYFRQPHSRSAGGEQIYCVACGRKIAELPPASHEPERAMPHQPQWGRDGVTPISGEGERGYEESKGKS
ncbi:MAG: hypothetical protein WCC71_20105 [Candidatus Sulfotelmatobacter sp.]